MKKAILVITGSRKEVLKRTTILTEMSRIDTTDTEYVIVTDPKNIGIFSSISKLNVRLYEMNATNYLILKDEEFHEMVPLANTELSYAFAREIIKNGSFSLRIIEPTPIDADIPYYFERFPIAIDQLHSIIRRENKFLVGINIGENEHSTKKLPVSFIVDLMKQISMRCQVKFVLFGTYENVLRSKMIERSFPDKIINIISLVEDLKKKWSTVNPNILEINISSQAIELCDLLISLDSFYMHLSTALKQTTLGLFANTSPTLTSNFKNLIKIQAIYEKECFPCENTQDQCPIVYMSDSEEYCMYSFSSEDIASIAVNTLMDENL